MTHSQKKFQTGGQTERLLFYFIDPSIAWGSIKYIVLIMKSSYETRSGNLWHDMTNEEIVGK